MKKAWCQTAQLILDHLNDGCELVVCMHETDSYGRYDRYDKRQRHGYVWHKERGEYVRTVQHTILKRLIEDGYVVETKRDISPAYTHTDIYGHHQSTCWRAIFRITEESEECNAHIWRNDEREAIFVLLSVLQKQKNKLARIPIHSSMATSLAQQIDNFCTDAIAYLSGSQPASAQSPQQSILSDLSD